MKSVMVYIKQCFDSCMSSQSRWCVSSRRESVYGSACKTGVSVAWADLALLMLCVDNVKLKSSIQVWS